MKTPERGEGRRSGICIVNFECISYLFLVSFVDLEHVNVRERLFLIKIVNT